MQIASLLDTVAQLVPGPRLDVDRLEVDGSAKLASAFDVDTAALVAAGLVALDAGHERIDRDRVVALFSGRVEVDGETLPKWADLSGYYDTADGGRIQLHCNFPHHRDGVVTRLACAGDRAGVAAAIARWDGEDLESELIAAGLIAARLRSLDDWAAHPHALATATLPLIEVTRLGDGPPRPAGRQLRVLDCSRVLAGPVAGMTLAALGADVLRVGAAHLPSVEVGVLGTGSGKRNAFVDLDRQAGRETFNRLLAKADVWVDAYRPGALAGKGFGLDDVAPGSVTVQISAFDWSGPWAGRRGFDSIVQSTTGIVDAGSRASGRSEPTPLPVQALDYCTGLLAAFAARRLVAHQATEGGTWLARLSLLRTRNWLVSLGGPKPFEPSPAAAPPAASQTVDTPFGAITAARPFVGRFAHGPQPLGSSPAEWL